MSDVYLKLPEDFFHDKAIKRLRRFPDGDACVIAAVKILLLSRRDDNHIRFAGVCDSLTDEIALEIDEDPAVVQKTVSCLLKWGWLKEVCCTDLYFPKAEELSGPSKSKATINKKSTVGRL